MSFTVWLVSNLAVASGLALAAAAVSRWGRRPALAHALWLLVLLKMVTPPVVTVRLPVLERSAQESAAAPIVERQTEREPQPDIVDRKGEPGAPDEGGVIEGDENLAEPDVEIAAARELRKSAEQLEDLENAFQLAQAQGGEAAKNGAADRADRGSRFWAALPFVWLAGALLWFVVAAVRLTRFQRLLRLAQPAAADLCQQAERLAERMGIACPQLCVVPGAVAPLLWGFSGRARLVLPQDLLVRLSPEQRSALLVHELAHYRRRDHWVRWLELLVLGLYWWCPLVWWARREIHEAEEACCDAWVVWLLPDAARDYAVALVETLDFLSGAGTALPPFVSGMAPVRLLRRRLTMIMRGTTPRSMTVWGIVLVVGAALALLPLLPTWAQEGTAGDGPATKRDLELRRLHEEIAKTKAQFERLRAEHEQRMLELMKHAEALRKATPPPKADGDTKEPSKKEPPKWSISGFKGDPDIGRRLTEVERKLDMVLWELQQMRKGPAKTPAVRPPGMGPGAGGPPGMGGGFPPMGPMGMPPGTGPGAFPGGPGGMGGGLPPMGMIGGMPPGTRPGELPGPRP